VEERQDQAQVLLDEGAVAYAAAAKTEAALLGTEVGGAAH